MGQVTIHCVRHAQGFHNLNTANHSLPDPDLTQLGKSQCATLSRVFPRAPCFSSPPKITHLVASPLRRTLYTCLLSFPGEVERGLVVQALPELQETSDLPCDTGSAPSKLREEFGAGQFAGTVDLGLVTDGWNSKTGRWRPTSGAIEARARDARVWLRKLAQGAARSSEEDVHIVVVTHGGYLHFLTEDWDGHALFTGTGWANTEFRSYSFVNADGQDADASLIETKESWEMRKGSEKPLTADEQRELRASAEEGFVTMEEAKL
jgi:broad specificity phosphatase PhoE